MITILWSSTVMSAMRINEAERGWGLWSGWWFHSKYVKVASLGKSDRQSEGGRKLGLSLQEGHPASGTALVKGLLVSSRKNKKAGTGQLEALSKDEVSRKQGQRKAGYEWGERSCWAWEAVLTTSASMQKQKEATEDF